MRTICPIVIGVSDVYKYIMTPEYIQSHWLSLRYWLQRTVLPSAVVLLVILGLFRLITDVEKDLNHNALLVGFFTLYFILVRGGHTLMIRSLHAELMRKYEEGYREKLGDYSREAFRRRNLGFTLAQIKRDLISDETRKRKLPFGE